MPPLSRRPSPTLGLVAWPALAVAQPPNWLAPRGPAAGEIALLWWILFALGAATFVIVVVLLVLSSVRRRDQDVATDVWTGEGSFAGGNRLVLLGGIVIPAVVVVGLMVLTVTTSVRADTVGNPGDPLVVEVTAHKFWFDVRYPEQDIRIANEIRLPVGEPVELVLTSADVIHSVWVPELGGKRDTNPGHVNTLRWLADTPGVYRGFCTEYCGVQHARMQFIAVAMEPDEFDDWVADRQDVTQPDDEDAVAGREVFIGAGCAECHTVEGVSPLIEDYPDLTHFANRLTIGAGTVPNNRGNLGGWILEPQGIKPGNRMPPSNLTGEELQALLDYLETLE